MKVDDRTFDHETQDTHDQANDSCSRTKTLD